VIVVDTNVLAHGVLPSEHGGLVRRLAARDPAWVAPPLWRLELRNVLATAMRLRGLPLARAVAAFAAAESLVVDAALEPTAAEILELTARGGISAYDAEFVFAADRLDVPLVTTDRKLARAFPGRATTLREFVDTR
jgi:predicted nucleic acid-binding protein